jgi:uncharacterized cupin superfamily protein
MPSVFHLDELEMTTWQERVPDFSWHTSPNLGDAARAKYTRFDVRSLDPGKYSYPYHFHRAAEELFIVLSGEATLRTPDGFQRVKKGDMIFFEEGPAGAHQLRNHGSEPCVYVDIRICFGIEVCEYPDSNKVSILPQRDIFERSSRVDYFTREENVAAKWEGVE